MVRVIRTSWVIRTGFRRFPSSELPERPCNNIKHKLNLGVKIEYKFRNIIDLHRLRFNQSNLNKVYGVSKILLKQVVRA